MSVPPGRIVYTQWLNEQGGISADLTVTRLAEDVYMVMTAFSSHTRDFNWLRSHIPPDTHAVLTDVTAAYAGINVQGPNARPCCRRSVQQISPTRLFHLGCPGRSSWATRPYAPLASPTWVNWGGNCSCFG
ncbi:MAG: hypothetical protein CM1200mP20_04760 [Pseudomonadota bacterium]|nr:MAG: hypothetical protein CM1200mP20_04760 [Pseudomonadota bacterium]